MYKKIDNYLNNFFNHPKEVCMTYFEHLKLSLNFSFLMFTGSIKAIIHAFLPDYYIKSTSEINNKITRMIQESGCNNKTAK